MKRGLLLLSVFVILISACSVGTVGQAPPKLDYQKTAGVAIERAVAEMKLPTALFDSIRRSDKISIVSMDSQGKSDNPIFTTVNDILIQEFVEAGYAILERDDRMIVNNHFDSGKLNGTKILVENENDMIDIVLEEMELNLTPADKVIAFKVKEIGVRYHPLSSGAATFQTTNNVRREAHAILTVRVIEPATGTILYSKTHEGKAEDTLNATLANRLEKMNFNFMAPSYPLMRKKRPAPAPRPPFGM